MYALHKHYPVKYLELLDYETHLKQLLKLAKVRYISLQNINNENYILFEYEPISISNTLECFLYYQKSFIYW